MIKSIFLLLCLSLTITSFSASNTLSKTSMGQIISVSETEDSVLIKTKDGQKHHVKFVHILDKEKKKKLQAGSYVQFYQDIPTNR